MFSQSYVLKNLDIESRKKAVFYRLILTDIQ